MGIEPTRPAWKAGILTIELHPLIFRATLIIIYNAPEKVKHFTEIYYNKFQPPELFPDFITAPFFPGL